MPDNEKMKQQLAKYKAELKKYKKYFLEDDGIIDSEEQKQLDAMLATIQSIEANLNGDSSKSSSSDDDEFNKILDEMEAIVKRKQDFLVAWDGKFGDDPNSNIA
jgi:hypothetical protein